MAKTEEVDISQLEDYPSDEEEEVQAAAQQAGEPEAKKDNYVALHVSGFKEFLLRPELLRTIVDSGFEHPSEVQHQAIPQAILGVDVVCQAKSGMGKTAVFVLAILQQGAESKSITTLVLCHTRELAYQICNEFDRFKTYMPNVKTAVFFGGTNIQDNRDRLRTDPPNILIGTPGRILGLCQEGSLDLKSVKHFVIDECDKVLGQLDMRRDVQRIFTLTPHNKQVMMFSATISPELREVTKRFMQSPLEIYIDDGSKLTLHGLQQYYVELQEKDKNRKLIDLLDALEFNQCIVFVRSVQRCVELNKLLIDCNFPSTSIHSSLSQDDRIDRYRRFKQFDTRIMVATNVFGRGIDIERVNVVINYDMPEAADTYLHRVGRAGRFGTKGLAVSFVSSKEDAEVLNDVQRRFVVEIKELPDEIDASSYMGS